MIFQDYEKIIYKLSQKCFILSNHNLFAFKPSSKNYLMNQLKNHKIIKDNTIFQYLETINNLNNNIDEKLKKKFTKLTLMLKEDKEYILLIQILHSYSILLFTNANENAFKCSSFQREMLMNFLDHLQPFININLKTNIDLFSSINLIEKYLHYGTYPKTNDNDIAKILNFNDLDPLFSHVEISLFKRYDEVISKVEKSNIDFVKATYQDYKISQHSFINLEEFKILPHWGNENNPHILVFISGFGSKIDDEESRWQKVVDCENFSNYDKFFIKWDSKEYIENWYPSNIYNYFCSAFSKNTNNLFRDAQKSARLSGILLAQIIASNKFFPNKTISLVGFSLGCHIIKHCLKELYMIDKLNIVKTEGVIQNVIFLAGATTIKNKLRWRDILQKIPGKIFNVRSSKDYILKYLYMNFGLKNILTFKQENGYMAIGMEDIAIEVLNKKDYLNLVTNFDLSGEGLGHNKYRNFLEEIFSIINFK